MMSPPADSSPDARPRAAAAFTTTRWSIVVRAAATGERSSEEALAQLCRTYWYPLYAHVRRRGHAVADAQDLTQEFFARLLSRRILAAADPSRGRFRAFILTVLDRFLADEWDKVKAQKRGGDREVIPLDLAGAEERFGLETGGAGAASPTDAFDRQWALALLEAALNRVEADYRSKGQHTVFVTLKPTLTTPKDAEPYSDLAAQLGVNEGAARVAVHRLRKRFRGAIEAEIAETVSSQEEVQDELRHLFRTLGGA